MSEFHEHTIFADSPKWTRMSLLVILSARINRSTLKGIVRHY